MLATTMVLVALSATPAQANGSGVGDPVISVGGSFTVTIFEGDAGCTSEIFLDNTGQSIAIADNDNTATGPVPGSFGPVAAGEEAVFSIDVSGLPICTPTLSFTTGTDQARVTEEDDGVWLIEFEDLPPPYDEGEPDYNDAVFRVVQLCDPEVEGECVTQDDEGTTAAVECAGSSCDPIVVVPDDTGEGDQAAFEVKSTKNDVLEMVVTMASKALSTPPGKAEVLIKTAESANFVAMDSCEKKSDVDCVVQIKKVKGALTQYTLRFKEDPRFRFR